MGRNDSAIAFCCASAASILDGAANIHSLGIRLKAYISFSFVPFRCVIVVIFVQLDGSLLTIQP